MEMEGKYVEGQAKNMETFSGVSRGGLGCSNPLLKFRSFEKVEPDCKLIEKCLVFLFQHSN